MQKHPRCRGCFCICSAVSYFSARVGSIIGADRLSFRVRDGTGRFPVAVAAVTLFKFVLVGGVAFRVASDEMSLGLECGCDVCVGKFSAG